jgi:hypothetical protein
MNFVLGKNRLSQFFLAFWLFLLIFHDNPTDAGLILWTISWKYCVLYSCSVKIDRFIILSNCLYISLQYTQSTYGFFSLLWIQTWHSFGVKTDTDNHWNFQTFYTPHCGRPQVTTARRNRLMVRQHLRNWFTRATETARQTVGTHQQFTFI